MPVKRKVLHFAIEWPPAAEWVSPEPCTRCSSPTRVYRTPGNPVQEVRFCPLCWRAVADDAAIRAASNPPLEQPPCNPTHLPSPLNSPRSSSKP